MDEKFALELKKRIVKTGDIGGNDFLFHMIVISEEEMDNLSSADLSILAKKHDIDFICVKKTGCINYMHYTASENLQSIEENGLKNSGTCKDLGAGIYVVRESDIGALINVQDYFAEALSYEDDSIVCVSGRYNGDYIECVHGFQHTGYIVLLTDHISPKEIDVYEVNLEDFLN